MNEIKDIYDLLDFIKYDYICFDINTVNNLYEKYKGLFNELGIYKELDRKDAVMFETANGSLGYLLWAFYRNGKWRNPFLRTEYQSFGECMKQSIGCDLTKYKIKDINKIIEICAKYGIYIEKFKDGMEIGLRKTK